MATIPLDCLELDYNHKWWIYRDRVKIPDGFKSPISTALAKEIEEQQSFIKQYFSGNEYLFASRDLGSREDNYVPQKNEPVKLGSYLYYLNKLAVGSRLKTIMEKYGNFPVINLDILLLQRLSIMVSLNI